MALQEAFLGFDVTLLERNVIKVLKTLAKKNPDDGETSEEEDDDENIADMCSEVRMPLEKVLKKYKDNKLNPVIDKLKAEGAGSSKTLSPFLCDKRCMAGNDVGHAKPTSLQQLPLLAARRRRLRMPRQIHRRSARKLKSTITSSTRTIRGDQRTVDHSFGQQGGQCFIVFIGWY
jgi:hypothetical protein